MKIKNRLITIPMSHYCEKARWALEYARIEYKEEGHLQGFHAIAASRIAQTDEVPILVTPQKILTDSTDILQWCDQNAAKEYKLFPTHGAVRKDLEQFEDFLDEGLGVAARLWMYTFLLDELQLIIKYSKNKSVPWIERILFPIVFPKMKKLIAKVFRMKPTSRSDTQKIIDQAFEEVNKKLADGRPFIFGHEFSAADITFAALSAPVILPEKYGVELPKLSELPEEMLAQVQRWREQPAGKHILKLYDQYRRF